MLVLLVFAFVFFSIPLTRDKKKKKERLSDAQRDEKEDDDKERAHHRGGVVADEGVVQKHHLSISSSSLRVVSRDFLFEEFRVVYVHKVDEKCVCLSLSSYYNRTNFSMESVLMESVLLLRL